MEGADDRMIKRAAANVNERRRMQNINTGFEALRDLIDVPNKSKLSKSAILRHSVDLVRNIISENQQLREQNLFLRNLYSAPVNSSSNIIIPSTSSQKNNITNQTCEGEVDETKSTFSNRDYLSSPAKKVKLSEEIYRNTSTPKSKTSPPVDASFKSPKKYSARISKLLASPKRMTRSSVITQNYAFYQAQSPGSLLESPTRRSTRIQGKDHLLTPPSSSYSLSNISGVSMMLESPNTRTKRVIDLSTFPGMFTPESIKNIPARSAKRSLDAIIQAIDQLEGS